MNLQPSADAIHDKEAADLDVNFGQAVRTPEWIPCHPSPNPYGRADMLLGDRLEARGHSDAYNISVVWTRVLHVVWGWSLLVYACETEVGSSHTNMFPHRLK